MSTPSSNKTLIFIIATLLVTNIAVLGYFLWFKDRGRPDGPHNRGRDNGIAKRLEEEVGFSKDQVAQYENLKSEQRKSIQPMFDEMRKAKMNLFRLMSDSTASDSVIHAAATEVGEQQKKLDLQTFAHFKKLREVCTPEQRPKYDSMLQQMFRKMGKAGRKEGSREESKNKTQ